MYININHVNLYYEEYGYGIPVICIHGFFADSHLMKGCLEPAFKYFNGFKRIYIDLVGMGNSPVDNTIKNSDDMLTLLSLFVTKVIGNNPFIIFGESYGGYLSLGLNKLFYQQVLGLFLICPVTVASHEKRTVPQKSLLIEQSFEVDASEQKAYKAFLNMAVNASKNAWKAYKKDIYVGVEKADKAYLKALSNNGYTLSTEAELRTTTFTTPSVVLLGKQDHVVGYKDAMCLEPNFPRGTFAILDRAGHNLQIEQPELFAIFVKNFLEQFLI